MKSFVFGLLVLYFTGSLARVSWFPAKRQNSCDALLVKKCITPLLSIQFDAESIEKTCSHLNRSKSCVKRYKCKPSNGIQTILLNADYLCSAEGKDVILTESQCLPNIDNQKNCSDVMEEEVMRILIFQDIEAMCRATKNFAVCMVKTMRADCSETAVNLMRNHASSWALMFKCDNQPVVVRDLVKLIARRK